MIIDFDLAETVLTAQPFSRLIGARLAAFETGTATLEIPIRNDLLQHDGYLHGGVLSYAADNAITFAAGSVPEPNAARRATRSSRHQRQWTYTRRD